MIVKSFLEEAISTYRSKSKNGAFSRNGNLLVPLAQIIFKYDLYEFGVTDSMGVLYVGPDGHKMDSRQKC
jgi:hypothetical protein